MDHLFYVKQMGEYLLVRILYVNGVIISTHNVAQLKLRKSEFEKEFEMSDFAIVLFLRVEFV